MTTDAMRERIVGAALRALGVAVGVTPAVVHGIAGGAGSEALAVQALLGLFAFVVLLGERRDGEACRALDRAAFCGVAGAIVCAGVATWAQHAGDLDAGYAALGRLARREWLTSLLVLVGVVLASPVWSPLLIVRSCTTRLLPQVLASAATAGVLVAMRWSTACAHELVPLDWALVVLLSGACAGAGAALVDRLLEAPAPPRPAPPRAALGRALVLGLLFLGTLLVATTLPQSFRSTRYCCVVSFRDEAGRHYLQQTREAGGVVPAWATGCRVARDARGWWATFDPPPGAHPLERRWRIDDRGALHAAPCGEVPPLPLDPGLSAVDLPAGWELVEGGAR